MNVYCSADIFGYFPHYRMIQQKIRNDIHGQPFLQIQYITTSDYDYDKEACRIPRDTYYHNFDDKYDNDPYIKYILHKFHIIQKQEKDEELRMFMKQAHKNKMLNNISF
jgi:hypothetical protein